MIFLQNGFIFASFKNVIKNAISTITNCCVETVFVRFLIVFSLFLMGINSGIAYAWQHDRAAYEVQRGNFDEAQKRLGKLIVEQPDNAEILYDAGVVSYEQKEYAQAQAYFHNAAFQAEQNHTVLLQERALFNEGNAYVKLQNFEKAIGCYDQVLAKNRNHEQALHNKKVVEEMLKQQQEQKKEEQKDSSCCNKDKKSEEKNKQNNGQESEQNGESQPDDKSGSNPEQKKDEAESNKKDSHQSNQTGKNNPKAQDSQEDTGTNPQQSKENKNGEQKQQERQQKKGDDRQGSQKKEKEKEQKGNETKEQIDSIKKENSTVNSKQEKSTNSSKKGQASQEKTVKEKEENGSDSLGMRADLQALLKEQEARDKQVQGFIFKEQMEKNSERKGVVHGW